MASLRSAAFEPGEPIPKKYTGEDEDVSPALEWSDLPDATKELALICDDPDAPTANPWVHWVVYGIPPDVSGLPEGSAGGAKEGANDFGRTGYGGPMPPRGHGTHHYCFTLYALSAPLNLEPGVTKNQLVEAIAPYVIDKAELIGTFER